MNYQMRLIDLMSLVESDTQSQIVITGLSMDSRRVKPGDMFMALATDAEQREAHIRQAAAANAAVVCFSADLPLGPDLTALLSSMHIEQVAVSSLKTQTARLAAAFYQYPSAVMTVIGVTGTNGKSSVTQFIAQALENAGYKCGVIGTLGSGRLTEMTHTGMTTPDPVTMQALLAQMRDNGIEYVALEASSHALQQDRLDFVDIDFAVLTNLSRDHLDYHQSMEAYAAAKQRLFHFASLRAAVINVDDNFGQNLLSILAKQQVQLTTYSHQSVEANVFASQIEALPDGLRFYLHVDNQSQQIHSRVLGKFNVENMLATTAVLSLLGWNLQQIGQALSELHSVNGRMQMLESDLSPSVVIDFAHTPDALAKSLTGMREHMQTSSRLWCVFGCGGDRDRGKRPLMGQVASQLADKLVLTDDNPRSENSHQIIEQILTGCMTGADITVKTDRREAIEYAIQTSAFEDMVLIAGKGHEHYQEVAGVKRPFNDYETAMQAIQARHTATRGIQ